MNLFRVFFYALILFLGGIFISTLLAFVFRLGQSDVGKAGYFWSFFISACFTFIFFLCLARKDSKVSYMHAVVVSLLASLPGVIFNLIISVDVYLFILPIDIFFALLFCILGVATGRKLKRKSN